MSEAIFNLMFYSGIREGELRPTDRLFTCTKSYLSHEMIRGCRLSGVKKIYVVKEINFTLPQKFPQDALLKKLFED